MGEGYFEVKQNGGVPFTVHTHGYDVVVKGTKFNVSAYEEDPFISTTLIEGKVTVNYKGRISRYATRRGDEADKEYWRIATFAG